MKYLVDGNAENMGCINMGLPCENDNKYREKGISSTTRSRKKLLWCILLIDSQPLSSRIHEKRATSGLALDHYFELGVFRIFGIPMFARLIKHGVQ